MPSKYYSEERECNKCGVTYDAPYMIGVRQPMRLLCIDCSSDEKEERIERVLGEHPDVWYRPDSEDKEIAVYKPDDGRWYFRHDLHAVQRIEQVYQEQEED